MSETCDVNVLVYATDRASPFSARAQALLARFFAGPAPVYLFWPVVMGYLRIATHPSILSTPLDLGFAHDNIARLLDQPHVRAVGETSGFWRAYRSVTDDVPARGNLVSDAHLVALMLQHGVSTIWSHDRDFRKFNGITVRDPFA